MLTIALWVIAAACVASVIATIPVFIQLKKTLTAAEATLKEVKSLVSEEVKPLAHSLNAAMEDVETVTKTAKAGAEAVGGFIEEIKHISCSVRGINDMIDEKLKKPLAGASSLMTGLRVGFQVLAASLKCCNKKEV